MAQNWVVDAAAIKIADTGTIDFFHKTHDIEKFFTKEDKRFAIVASRGVGKTYLLKMKSIKYRKEKKGAVFIPKGNLVDRFSSSDKPIISYNDMSNLTDIAIHMKLWKVSILVSIIKNVPSLLEKSKVYYHSYPELESLLSSSRYVNHSPVHNIYEDLMKNYKYFMNLIKKGALNILDAICSTNLDESLYIFLDNLDEFYDVSHHDEDNGDYTYSEDLWIASQVALLKTVYQLQQSINKINIYLTIRKRAIDEMQKRDMMALQYSGSILYLNYTKQDLKDIFIKNIEQETKRNLVHPDKKGDPFLSFTGLASMPNAIMNIEEEMFDYIYRHSFGRPRELMATGSAISNISKDLRADIGELRKCINNISREIGVSYIKELEPFMEDIDFHRLYGLISKNIYSADELKSLCCEYNIEDKKKECAKCENVHVFCKLYTQGLIGYAYSDVYKQKVVQKFMEVGRQPIYNANHSLPQSDYYFIHPSFGDVIEGYKKDHELGEYSSSNQMVVGQNREVVSLPFISTQKIHTHFGAGNLGIGLTIKSFDNQKNKIIIIQRESSSFDRYYTGQNIVFRSSSQEEVFFEGKVILDTITDDDLDSSEHILFISGNVDEIKKVIVASDSYSSSLNVSGIKKLPRYFKGIKFDGDKNFYPFENDGSSVNDFFKAVDNEHLVPALVVADRICTNRNFKNKSISVNTEPYRAVVIKRVNSLVEQDVDTSSPYIKIVPPNEYQFHKDQKYYMVNGVHTILAIAGYEHYNSDGYDLDDVGSIPLTLILKEHYVQNIMKNFMLLQAIRVINLHYDLIKINSEGNILQTFEELKEYGENIIKRFESNRSDKLERILNLSSDKLEDRAKKLQDRFLSTLPLVSKYRDEVESLNLISEENLKEIIETALDINKRLVNLLIGEIKEKNEKIKELEDE